MREASLKFKMYANNVGNIGILEHATEKFVLHAVLWSFGALALFYLLLLGNMVFNIVERRGLEAEARSLSSEVSELELDYLALSNEIDLSMSHAIGFKEIKAKFATRKSQDTLGSIKVVKNEI